MSCHVGRDVVPWHGTTSNMARRMTRHTSWHDVWHDISFAWHDIRHGTTWHDTIHGTTSIWRSTPAWHPRNMARHLKMSPNRCRVMLINMSCHVIFCYVVRCCRVMLVNMSCHVIFCYVVRCMSCHVIFTMSCHVYYMSCDVCRVNMTSMSCVTV